MACTTSVDDPAEPSPSLLELQQAPRCASADATTVSGRVELLPVAGTGVSGEDARSAVEHAAAVWRPLGLDVVTLGVERAPVGEIIGGEPSSSCASMTEALREQCEAEAVLAPLAAAIERLAVPRVEGRVVMVGLERLVADSKPLRALGLDLRGLAVVDARVLEQASVTLSAGTSHTPIVFVDVGTPRRPGDLWLTPAHELGHALGLAHTRGGPSSLMRSGLEGQRCRPDISASEADVVGRAGGVLSEGP